MYYISIGEKIINKGSYEIKKQLNGIFINSNANCFKKINKIGTNFIILIIVFKDNKFINCMMGQDVINILCFGYILK